MKDDPLNARNSVPTQKLPDTPLRTPWFLPTACAAAILMIAVRLFQLNTLQNELYGDIELDHTRLERVFSGQWPFDFVLSIGPLYHYLVTPIVALVGMSYFGLKLTTVIVSLCILLVTYALSRRLIDDRFALLAVTVAGMSSWLLIWSRLGNSPIVVPLVTTSALWLMVRFLQTGRNADLLLCAVVATLGLYSFPQGFVMPGVVLITLIVMRRAVHPISWRQLGMAALVMLACALPFGWIVWKNPVTFTTGYVGSKFLTSENPFTALLRNLTRGALAFHVRGDMNFRANPLGEPHLDWLSGLLFILGIGYWLRPAQRRWSPTLLIPFALLQLPSVLVLGRPAEVPSATRTLGVAPLAYVLVASGIWWLASALRSTGRLRVAGIAVGVLLAAIFGLNMQRYFGDYISGLPYHNTSISANIAVYADMLPPQTQVYLAGCCWEASMPEAPFVKLVVKRPQNLHELDPSKLSCGALEALQQPAVVIWSFKNSIPASSLEPCQQWLPGQLYLSPAGWPVFYAAPLKPGKLSGAGALPLPTAAEAPRQDLVGVVVGYEGQQVTVRTSPLDIGAATDLFDHNPASLVRGRDANPLMVELQFDTPRTVNAVGLDLATMPQVRLTMELRSGNDLVAKVTRQFSDLPADPHVELTNTAPSHQVSLVRIAIEDLRPAPSEGYHVHLRELQVH